jgi:hypothetical protein
MVLRARHPGWAVGIATERGYVLVTSDASLVKGEAYDACKTVGDVVSALANEAETTP